MKLSALLICALLGCSSNAQMKEIDIDTLCDCPRPKDSRLLRNYELLIQYRFGPFWKRRDYFVIKKAKNHYYLINRKGKPMKRSHIFSPRNMVLSYVYINENPNINWKYDCPHDTWLNCGPVPDSDYNLDAPRLSP